MPGAGDLKDGTPRTFGIVLYTQVEVLDVFGPIEALNQLSRNLNNSPSNRMTCYTIAQNKGIINTAPAEDDPGYSIGSSFNQPLVATHSFDDPPDVDMLFLPGGLGPKGDERTKTVNFVESYYNDHIKGRPNKYLFTVCTGSWLAAESSVLNGVWATSNKKAWAAIAGTPDAPKHPHTSWNADARWVVDQGNIWTTSGVSAGTDGMVAWIAEVYGEDKAEFVCNGMEYNRESDPKEVKFAKLYNAQDVPATE